MLKEEKKDKMNVEGVKLIAMKFNNNGIQTSVTQYHHFVTVIKITNSFNDVLCFCCWINPEANFEGFMKANKKMK